MALGQCNNASFIHDPWANYMLCTLSVGVLTAKTPGTLGVKGAFE